MGKRIYTRLLQRDQNKDKEKDMKINATFLIVNLRDMIIKFSTVKENYSYHTTVEKDSGQR